MDTIFAISGRLAHALAVIAKLIIGLIVLLVTFDVLARNFGKPLAWTVSLTEYLLIYVAFLSAPELVRLKGHVCADFIRGAMPGALQRIFERATYVLCIGLCAYLGWLAGVHTVESYQTGAYDVRTFDMPKVAIFLPMAVGLWLSALEFARFLAGRDSIYAVDISQMEGF